MIARRVFEAWLLCSVAWAPVAGAQSPSFVSLQRKSECPGVRIRDLGARGATAEIDAILLRDSTVMFALGAGAPDDRFNFREPEIQFMHFGGNAEFKRSHDVAIAIDDSIRIRPGTRYRSTLLADNALMEVVAATVSREDLKRVAAGKRVTIQLSELKLEMTPQQIHSVQMLLDELGATVSNRMVPNYSCTNSR